MTSFTRIAAVSLVLLVLQAAPVSGTGDAPAETEVLYPTLAETVAANIAVAGLPACSATAIVGCF